MGTTGLRDTDDGLLGWFFVTIATHHGRRVLGRLDKDQGLVHLSALGRVVRQTIRGVVGDGLDATVIMPDHVHFLVHVQQRSVRQLVRSVKSATTREGRRAGAWNSKFGLWTSGQHIRRIHGKRHLEVTRAYIHANPERACSRL